MLSASLDTMVTDGVSIGFTVVVIALLVAGFPVAHGVAFEVNTTVTISLLTNAALVYVLEFVPTLVPFNFH